MVGVPGRSKGCHTCLQRRVKCDEEKPLCSRCVRAGFECLGYARELQWRHHPGTAAGSRALLPQTAGPGHVPPTGRLPSDNGRSRRMRREPTTTLSFPPQLSLHGFEDDVCLAYVFSNIVWRGYGASWLRQSAQGMLGQLALDAVKALAETSFGRSQKAYQTEIQGQLRLGRAMRCLIETLGDEAQTRNPRRLMVPVLLFLMQSATLINPAAASFHLQAMTRILTICGPHAFQEQPFRDAFEAARATIVVASLVTRQRVFLDDPAWHSAPYALEPSAKPAQSFLVDILTSVPSFLQDHETLEQQGSAAASPAASERARELRSGMVARVEAKLQAAFEWRWHWQATFGAEVVAVAPVAPEDPGVQEQTQPSSFVNSHSQPGRRLHFARPGAAADISLYNGVVIWLVALLEDLEPATAGERVRRCADQAMEAAVASNNVGAGLNFFNSSSTSTSSSSSSNSTSSNNNNINNNNSRNNSGRNNSNKLTIHTSFDPLASPGSCASPLAATKARGCALEICRVFEWQSRSRHAAAETCVYMLGIGLALCLLDGEPLLRAWIRAMLDANALTRNYGRAAAASASSGGGSDSSPPPPPPSPPSPPPPMDHHLTTLGRPPPPPSITDVLVLDDGGVGQQVVAASHTRVLHQLQGFASSVTRELAGGSRPGPEEAMNPGLVHLLLLRGPLAV